MGLYAVAVSAMDQLPEIQKQHANLTALVNRELRALDAEGCPNVWCVRIDVDPCQGGFFRCRRRPIERRALFCKRKAQARQFSTRDMIAAAGHESASAAGLCPSAMLFVPSADGISHNPKGVFNEGAAGARCSGVARRGAGVGQLTG